MPFPLLGPLIAAGSSIIGGMISHHGQDNTNAANAALAQRQMDFQREMSSTAYQRSTADMRAAGINPMLAYMQGGASTPQGTMATMQNPEAALGASVGDAGTAAIASARSMKEMQLLEQQVKTQRHLTEKASNEANVSAFPLSFPDTVVSGSGPSARRLGDTWMGRQTLADMAMKMANSSSALAQSRINTERLPFERLKAVPGRMWQGLGRLLLGGGAERPSSSAFQRWSDSYQQWRGR